MNLPTSLAAVRITGADAKTFLQGQLSNDLNLLNPERSQLTSCNSAQGRVQAVVTLIERSDCIVAILPGSMVDLLVTRLRKYVLRSKVVIGDATMPLHCIAATREQLIAAQLPAPTSLGEHIQHNHISVIRWYDSHTERYLVVQETEEIKSNQAWEKQWLLDDIRAGLPQIFPQTHEWFIAQMLNLDALSGISFNKGCYTGQEIIARTHFRGTVKRRMYRMHASCPPSMPATRILLQNDQSHAGDVVMSASVENGCEMLAVLNVAQHDAALYLETHPAVTLNLMQLPYHLPAST